MSLKLPFTTKYLFYSEYVHSPIYQLPNEILYIIISFLDLKDSFHLIGTCRQFLLTLKHNETHWKNRCLLYWNNMCQKFKRYIDDSQLQRVQNESGKSWFWMTHCFMYEEYTVKPAYIIIGSRYNEAGHNVCIGDNLIGHGLFDRFGNIADGTIINSSGRYSGSFNDILSGSGRFLSNCGTMLEGRWEFGKLHGYGTMTYPDGYMVKDNWVYGEPQYGVSHPKVRQCLENQKCTNALSSMPQKFGLWVDYLSYSWTEYYCQHCWLSCCRQKPWILKHCPKPHENMKWNIATRCDCKCYTIK
jgi:hypothetical protein